MFTFFVEKFYYLIGVFVFWLCWQILDKLFYKNRCSKCKSRIKNNPRLEMDYERIKNKFQLEQRKNEELSELLARTKEIAALWHINNLSEKEISDIVGVGPVRVSKISENRPFSDWKQFVESEKISPYLEKRIFSWSNQILISKKKHYENR